MNHSNYSKVAKSCCSVLEKCGWDAEMVIKADIDRIDGMLYDVSNTVSSAIICGVGEDIADDIDVQDNMDAIVRAWLDSTIEVLRTPIENKISDRIREIREDMDCCDGDDEEFDSLRDEMDACQRDYRRIDDVLAALADELMNQIGE